MRQLIIQVPRGNRTAVSDLLFDLPLEQQELLSGGVNSDNEDSYSDKLKYKYKYKDKDKENTTNFLIYNKDINGSVEINITISM